MKNVVRQGTLGGLGIEQGLNGVLELLLGVGLAEEGQGVAGVIPVGRRLRLHGLIERTPHSYHYPVTDLGLRVALFFTKVHSRILRPGLSQLFDGCPKAPNRPVATAMHRLNQAFAALSDQAKLEPCKI